VERVTRREALRRGAAGAVVLSAAGALPRLARAAAGCTGSATLNWLTWSDHYVPDQLQRVRRATGIGVRPNLFSDDADAYVKVKQASGQWDVSSADALWVPKFFREGLIEAIDLGEIAASKQLYSVGRHIPFWRAGSNQMAYPFGWSSRQIYYNPKYVRSPPRSWEVLTDRRYAKRYVDENQPTTFVAMAGLATHARHPYDMTSTELSRARGWLKAVKPQVLKLVSQNTEVVRALADGTAWLATGNLGTDVRVRAAGGPVLEAITPREGTYGFVDGEMLLRRSRSKESFPAFVNAAEQAPWIAKNFLANGRPLFNEKAYKLLVNGGHKERADRFFYNEPERALRLTLAAPSGDAQAYVDLFNEIFGG
jgi:spermidine/putrescine-binding protein